MGPTKEPYDLWQKDKETKRPTQELQNLWRTDLLSFFANSINTRDLETGMCEKRPTQEPYDPWHTDLLSPRELGASFLANSALTRWDLDMRNVIYKRLWRQKKRPIQDPCQTDLLSKMGPTKEPYDVWQKRPTICDKKTKKKRGLYKNRNLHVWQTCSASWRIWYIPET